jgi:hypothetical protein
MDLQADVGSALVVWADSFTASRLKVKGVYNK